LESFNALKIAVTGDMEVMNLGPVLRRVAKPIG
jgi:hypothetical protein